MKSWTWTTMLLVAIASPCLGRASPAIDVEHGKAATADASPVEPGDAEVEVAYTPSWQRRRGTEAFDAGDEGHSHGWITTLAYGVAPDLDACVGVGLAAVYDNTLRRGDPAAPDRGLGLGDVTVGARWRFLQLAEQNLEAAFTTRVVAPVGARQTSASLGVSQGYWSGYGAVVATRDFGQATVNAEVGFGAPLTGGAGGLRSLLQANLAAGWQATPWLQPELELNYGATFGTTSRVLAGTVGVVAPFGSGQRVVAAVQRDLWGVDATRRTAAVVAFKTAL